MKEEVRKVLKSVADPKTLSSDDQGCVCTFCHPEQCGWYDYLKDPSKYPHEHDCPVLVARSLLAKDGG